MTSLYTFETTLAASITVEAESREEAERIITGVIGACAMMTLSEYTNEDGDAVSGEATVIDSLDLMQIDGEDV